MQCYTMYRILNPEVRPPPHWLQGLQKGDLVEGRRCFEGMCLRMPGSGRVGWPCLHGCPELPRGAAQGSRRLEPAQGFVSRSSRAGRSWMLCRPFARRRNMAPAAARGCHFPRHSRAGASRLRAATFLALLAVNGNYWHLQAPEGREKLAIRVFCTLSSFRKAQLRNEGIDLTKAWQCMAVAAKLASSC